MSVIPCQQNEELRRRITEYSETLKVEAHKLGTHGLDGPSSPGQRLTYPDARPFEAALTAPRPDRGSVFVAGSGPRGPPAVS